MTGTAKEPVPKPVRSDASLNQLKVNCACYHVCLQDASGPPLRKRHQEENLRRTGERGKEGGEGRESNNVLDTLFLSLTRFFFLPRIHIHLASHVTCWLPLPALFFFRWYSYTEHAQTVTWLCFFKMEDLDASKDWKHFIDVGPPQVKTENPQKPKRS